MKYLLLEIKQQKFNQSIDLINISMKDGIFVTGDC